MPTRAYKLARTLGVDSKTLLEMARNLGIGVPSHMSSLSDQDVAKLKAAISEREGHVVRFDKSTGKGEVSISTSGETKDIPFDLKWTRLANAKYAPIQPGGRVRVTLNEQGIESMHVEQG
jgi:hypothetical protein